jgi:threonylcarbamoyladenosine tRNA methylthiotransferase MtaB
VVTGCYAQNDPEAAAAIPGVDVVVGNAAKMRVVDFLEKRNGRTRTVVEPLPDRFEEGPEMRGPLGGRTRAFLKIQDGCDQRCAYCAVRLARGRARSRPWPSVHSEARRALDAGYREIVLTGVNLGSYGRDLGQGDDLAGVTSRLASMPGMGRIRLSSVEPQEITDALIDVVGSHPNVCRHFHLPFQSGSDSVLGRMNRSYSAREFEDQVMRISRRIPDCGLGADVMVGFPGETDAEFRETKELVERLPITYLHVFSYSPRPETAATEMEGRVPGEIRKARSLAMRNLGRRKAQDSRTRSLGQTLEVLFETQANNELSGLSDNYLRVVARGSDDRVNSLSGVEISDVTGDGVRGILVSSGRSEGPDR